jgi:protein phosphatase 1 regulatory subunit 3A/B/C/D/E
MESAEQQCPVEGATLLQLARCDEKPASEVGKLLVEGDKKEVKFAENDVKSSETATNGEISGLRPPEEGAVGQMSKKEPEKFRDACSAEKQTTPNANKSLSKAGRGADYIQAVRALSAGAVSANESSLVREWWGNNVDRDLDLDLGDLPGESAVSALCSPPPALPCTSPSRSTQSLIHDQYDPGISLSHVDIHDDARSDSSISSPSSHDARKKVTFADERGFLLAVVEHYDPDDDEDEEMGWSMLSSSTVQSYQAGAAAGGDAGTGEERRVGGKWRLTFQQPCCQYQQFRDKVEHYFVSLENVLVYAERVCGTIKVKNICFQKRVFVRYTQDKWANFTDVPARYVPNSGSLFDQFAFEFDVPLVQQKKLEEAKEDSYICSAKRNENDIGSIEESDKDTNGKSDNRSVARCRNENVSVNDGNVSMPDLESELVSIRVGEGFSNETILEGGKGASVEKLVMAESLELAVCFVSQFGVEFWDNNDGANYVIVRDTAGNTPEPQTPTYMLSFRDLRLLGKSSPVLPAVHDSLEYWGDMDSPPAYY